RFEVGNNLTLNIALPGSVSAAVCGNNIKEGTEVCDGTDLNSQTCALQVGTGYTGTLSCDVGCTAFVTTSCVAPAWAVCGDNLTYAGEIYPTVQIGTQCWFAKSLNVGTQVLASAGQGTDCSTSSAIKKYCNGDTAGNCTTYGGEYTWDQAMCGITTAGAQGICPSGWHVPTDPEYVVLTNYLYGSVVCSSGRVGNSNYCGGPAGDKMKAAGLCDGRTPCGTSGFNALFGGADAAGIGYYVVFWTSSINGSEAWRSGLALNSSYANGQDATGVDATYYYSDHSSGRYIRCVKN
ncbi:MAG: FISUMP domain-containing protein, partial [Candidatus Doudnabacteria bacterium]